MESSVVKARIIVSFDAKLDEMDFFRKMIDSEWKATIYELASNGQIKDLTHHDKINYYFSGFSNSFQSIKDVLHAITGAAPWSEFSSISNFLFIKNSRNAITHDGLQLINTFNCGRYYVTHAGGTLIRYDDHNKEVKISCPTEDIVTVCNNFYLGLLKTIKNIINTNQFSFKINPEDNLSMIMQSINENSIISRFVNEFIKDNPALITESLEQMSQHKEKTIIEKIDERITKISSENT